MPENKKQNQQKQVQMKQVEDRQQKIMQFQILQQNFQAVQQQVQQVAQKVQELQQAKQSLEDFEKVKPSDALVPIGGGNYISGKISNSDEILVTFGAGVAVKKSRSEAVKITESRIFELQKLVVEMSTQQNLIGMQLQSLQAELQKAE